MSEVRRANPNGLSEGQISDLLSGETGEISDLKITDRYDVTGFDDGYPYSGQLVIVGNFTYYDNHPFEEGQFRPVPVEFMFREGSRLFIINADQQKNVHNEILRHLNSHLPTGIRLQPGFSSSRNEIWSFIKKANEIQRIRVWDEDELVDIDELDLPEEELTKKLVWDAELYFEHPETKEEELVIYNEESLSVEVKSISEIEHIIQDFERFIL